MDYALPTEMTHGAILREGEYAWDIDSFPRVVETAARLGFACLGGQFWLVLPDSSLYEPFWLDADSGNRAPGEPWQNYARRSCREVLSRFNRVVDETDWVEEAQKFSYFEPMNMDDFDATFRLFFNAYFISEQEFTALYVQRVTPISTLVPDGRRLW